MPYRIVDLELSQPLSALALGPEQDGFGLIARWQGRLVGFVMKSAAPGVTMAEDALRALVEREFGTRILAVKAEAALDERWPRLAPDGAPSLSIAICTKDRAPRLRRLLGSLDAVRSTSRFRSLEILVVDNASVDSSTRDAAQSFPAVRYVSEPRTGLDFARNAALHAATGDLLAYLDDDVVVDRHWLSGLYQAWADCPEAGGYTGLVLPFRLDTRAQLEFERLGGFGRGFARTDHRAAKLGNPLHPVGAGIVGAGCNMAFDRALLLSLSGFDEALDTGAPLPGGGDLDIFYRILRAGRTIVYEPRYAVYHEHRETLKQLRRQYWSWGVGFMAFLVKARRTDAALRTRHTAMIRWWFLDKLRALAGAILRVNLERARFVAGELLGGIQGLLGAYDRSVARSRRIRKQPRDLAHSSS